MQNIQSVVQDATDADRAMAQKRLKTWVPDVNPDDHSHIDAYLLAKMQSKRVSLNNVLQILKQQTVSVEEFITRGSLSRGAPCELPQGPVP